MCFHTTQYDLNLYRTKKLKQWQKEFPYYIVRFKPKESVYIFSVPIEFPYYIVRFKRHYAHHADNFSRRFPYYIVRFKQKTKTMGQNEKRGFPYYIVRFKPQAVNAARTGSKSFHTTQYDLNKVQRFFSEETQPVSILHSTI